MKRPFLIEISPLAVRTWLYYRVYRARREKWKPLYTAAPLYFCPSLRMDLLPTDDAHSNIAFTGFYELDLSRRIDRLAREGGLMVDVGANYGYFSLLWAGMNPANRVMAFEASPKNHSPLRRNIDLNRLGDRIELHDVAVGREAGHLRFTLGPEDETGWGGFTLSKTDKAVEVPVRRLDEMVPADVVVNVLKIDVEGADTWVIYGAEKLLREKRIRHVFFEQQKERMPQLGIGLEDAADYLRKWGYEVAALHDPAGGLVEYHAFLPETKA